jgi:molybdate/tungstate transport system substrate-binding protein
MSRGRPCIVLHLALGALLALPMLLPGCRCGGTGEDAREPVRLRVFHAAGITPLLEAVRPEAEADLGIELAAEGSGSQVAVRKLTELGRPCDLLFVADNRLVGTLAGSRCDWRIDFATDEVVLGVGTRAPHVDEAQENWAGVLRRDDVRIARVDESQGPIGYRTLLVWKLAERQGHPGLYRDLLAKTDKVVDHVSRLTPLLKMGEADYAFVYRSICIASDIRYIPLDRKINLGDADTDYSTVSFALPPRNADETPVELVGEPILWSASIPRGSPHREAAQAFLHYLLEDRRDELDRHGFRPLQTPRFAGPESAFAPFAELARRTGPLQEE